MNTHRSIATSQPTGARASRPYALGHRPAQPTTSGLPRSNATSQPTGARASRPYALGHRPAQPTTSGLPRSNATRPAHTGETPALPWASARAFTLLEVCIAMTIGMLILGVAVMGITGVADEQRLRETAATIESTARNALLDAISKHQPVQLALDGGLGGSGGTVEVKRYGDKNFRAAQSGEFWEFSPTGVCEPIELRMTSPDGIIELGFDPLTGCARKKSIIVNS